MRALATRLRKRFPEGSFVLDRPSRAGGVWFLDATVSGHTVNVQWKRGQGFGITATSEPGFGEGPHEVIGDRDLDAAFERVRSLLLSQTYTRVPTLSLAGLRRELGVSQVTLASLLQIQQASVSKLEKRTDMKISTLRAVIGALGAVLELRAHFSGQIVRIVLDDTDSDGLGVRVS